MCFASTQVLRDQYTQALHIKPKIIVIDIATRQVLKSFEFPESVFDHASFLNGVFIWSLKAFFNFPSLSTSDIVVDEVSMVAYMSDTAAPSGGIAVYDYKTDTARKFVGASTHTSIGTTFVIEGASWNVGGATDGIALSPDRQRVYFSKIQGRDVHSLPTNVMRNFALSESEWAVAVNASVVYHGEKTGISDGMTFRFVGLHFAVFAVVVLVTPLSTQCRWLFVLRRL